MTKPNKLLRLNYHAFGFLGCGKIVRGLQQATQQRDSSGLRDSCEAGCPCFVRQCKSRYQLSGMGCEGMDAAWAPFLIHYMFARWAAHP